jgi:hypothetical protein
MLHFLFLKQQSNLKEQAANSYYNKTANIQCRQQPSSHSTKKASKQLENTK